MAKRGVSDSIDKNSYYGTDFNFFFPTTDDITTQLKKLGPGMHLFKVNVSRAFQHICMDPRDYDLLGLEWQKNALIEVLLLFDVCHGMQIFQRLSDAVRFLMPKHGFNILNYVDDLIGVGMPSVAERAFKYLLALMDELGLDVSKKKLVPLATKVVCFGIEINTVEHTLSIPRSQA